MTDLTIAAGTPEVVTASPSARTITGRVVPYGPAGQTSQGRLTFAAGSLRYGDPKRVKLLLEHDQRQVAGHALSFEDRPDGLYATFAVPEHPLGDTALLEATHGLRDAFSVGVQVDDTVATKLRRANGAPVAGTGQLREVSLVSVPAFDDARVENTAASNGSLIVSAWSDASPTPPDPEPESPDPAEPSREDTPMPDTVEPDAPTAPVVPTQPEAPATVQAAYGSALVTGSPATYTFDGTGPSLVRDAFMAATAADPEAACRLARFNAELADGNRASHLALAAVATRTTLDELVNPSVRQPDLLVNAIDLGRPFWSRVNPIRIANAQPFLLPVEGEFAGVAAHTEGTAHVAEGTLTLTEVTVTPRAVSGAYRVSRELVDSSNPAVDRVAINAMLRDYRRVSEALAVSTLVTYAGAAVTSVNTVAELRAQLIDFAGDNDYPADFVMAGNTFYATLAAETAGDGRPQLPYLNPHNAVGQVKAGYTGATVDGVDIVRSSSMTTGSAIILATDGVIFAESPVQTFRFDQPEGPGIIKLALFAYQAVAGVRAGSARLLTTA
jgi:HK97 family phage prohead protease